jgi:hypothetical protein
MIEAPAQQTSFPTLVDVLDAVRTAAIDHVSAGDIDTLSDAFGEMFTIDPLQSNQPDIALINLIAYAGAAFAVCDVYRNEGDDLQAGLFHAMGQDFLAKAMDALGFLIAVGIRVNGITRH